MIRMSIPSDRELVSTFLEEVTGYSQDEAAAMVDGVTATDVWRWRNGEWKRLSAKKRRDLITFVERQRDGGAEERPEDVGRGSEEDELFEDFDRVVRYMKRMGPPGSEEKRKRAALQALHTLLAATGPIPSWWYDLRDRLDAAEL